MAWYNSARDLGNTFKDFGQAITGSKGVLGSYTPEKYEINKDAFTDTGRTDARTADFANRLAAAEGRQGPQIDTFNQNQTRGGQMELISALQGASRGEGPSAAQSQLQSATDRNIRQAMALGTANQAGQVQGAAVKNILNSTALAGQEAANSSATLRAQEQLAARDQLAGVLANARSQDLGLATNQAQLNLQQGQLNDNMARFYNESMMNMDMNADQRRMLLEQLLADQNLSFEKLRSGAFESQQGRRAGVLGGLAGSGAMAAKYLTPGGAGADAGAKPPGGAAPSGGGMVTL